MQTLLFSFLLNNIPLSSLSVLYTAARFCLSSSFSSFRIFSALSLSCPNSTYSLHTLPFSSNFSFPPSFFSPVGALGLFWLLSFIFWRWCRVGVAGVGVAGSTSYPICVSIMKSCPLNPPLIHQPASQPAQPASSRHTQHWLMAVRAPVHSTHQPAFIPQPQWIQNVHYPTTELYSTGL